MTRLFFLSILVLVASSCRQSQMAGTASHENQFEVLLNYLEGHGDYINSADMPSILNAAVVYGKLDSNQLVIDIRDQEDFNQGHIRHAVRVEPAHMLSYFETVIEPSGFGSIVLVCNTGMTSSYVAALFRLLGYSNVYSMGFGLSAWDRDIAENNWLRVLSAQQVEDLEKTPNEIKPGAERPVVQTPENMPYKVLRSRVSDLLQEDLDRLFVDLDDLYAAYDNYFIASFRPENLYDHSHLRGSFHFQPGVALKSSELLFALPADKPVLLYCNRGHTSAFGMAYLRVLGYHVHSLANGASSFMHATMQELLPDRTFSERSIGHFPLVSEGISSTPEEEPTVKQHVLIQGGC